MPAPISTDLRIRIVESRAQEGLTYEELAERYQVGRATVDRVLRLARETGSVEPAAHAGGPARQIKEAEQKMLCELLMARPDATLEELCEALAVRTGVRVSAPTMCRELKLLGWSRKKIGGGQGAAQSGSNIAMTRTQAWAPRGQRAHGVIPRNRGTVTTMLGALSIDGIEAMMTVEGGTTAAVFIKFLDDHLVPRLRPGDVVVMDNLGAHYATGVRERIEACGAEVLYQPGGENPAHAVSTMPAATSNPEA